MYLNLYTPNKYDIIMKKITIDNFEREYIDGVEQTQIDKFVCDEMLRQIHRYIKAMSGSIGIMKEFDKRLQDCTPEQKEKAISAYIDFNRKVLKGLDYKIILTRAMANYSDTFDYFITMIENKAKFEYYINRIHSKYERFHEIFEENGKYGMKNFEGEVMISPKYEFLRTCRHAYVDDLCMMPVIAEKDGKLGLIMPDGKDTLVADFVYEDIAIRDEPPFFEVVKDGRTTFINRYGKKFETLEEYELKMK